MATQKGRPICVAKQLTLGVCGLAGDHNMTHDRPCPGGHPPCPRDAGRARGRFQALTPPMPAPGRLQPVLGQSERFAPRLDLTHRSESPYRRFLAPGRDQKGPKRPSAARLPGHSQAPEAALTRGARRRPPQGPHGRPGRLQRGSKAAHAAAAVGPHRALRRPPADSSARERQDAPQPEPRRPANVGRFIAPVSPPWRPRAGRHGSVTHGVKPPAYVSPRPSPHVGGLQGPRHGARCGPRVGEGRGRGHTRAHLKHGGSLDRSRPRGRHDGRARQPAGPAVLYHRPRGRGSGGGAGSARGNCSTVTADRSAWSRANLSASPRVAHSRRRPAFSAGRLASKLPMTHSRHGGSRRSRPAGRSCGLAESGP